ncbi:MAG: Ig-like domain-containing protein [Oscillospiraceae bacterium]
MKKLIVMIAVLAASAILLTACSTVEIVNLAAKNKDITLKKGETQVLEIATSLSKENATAEDIAKALEKAKITFVSDNNEIVEITGNSISAKAAGSAVVTAKTEDGKLSADFNITVIVPIEKITAPEKIDLEVGKTEKLDISITPADTTESKTALFKSTDEKIATVDTDGVVTAVAAGECKIIANIGNIEATTLVTVTAPVVEKPAKPAKQTTNTNQGGGNKPSAPAVPSAPAPEPVAPPPAPAPEPPAPAPAPPEPAPPAGPVCPECGGPHELIDHPINSGVIIPGDDAFGGF